MHWLLIIPRKYHFRSLLTLEHFPKISFASILLVYAAVTANIFQGTLLCLIVRGIELYGAGAFPQIFKMGGSK